jgi:hypothetical protein
MNESRAPARRGLCAFYCCGLSFRPAAEPAPGLLTGVAGTYILLRDVLSQCSLRRRAKPRPARAMPSSAMVVGSGAAATVIVSILNASCPC